MTTEPRTPSSDAVPLRPSFRPAACLGLLVTAIGIASVGIGRFVVLPMMVRAHALVDANLARSLAQPIHLRLAEITLAATLVVFVVLPRWTKSRLAAALAMLLVMATAAWRAVLLPALYGAWAKVDLVAGRPLDQLQAARTLDGYEQAANLAIMLTLIALAWIGLRNIDPVVRRTPVVASEPLAATSGTIEVPTVAAAR
jgi:hypothetical protein